MGRPLSRTLTERSYGPTTGSPPFPAGGRQLAANPPAVMWNLFQVQDDVSANLLPAVRLGEKNWIFEM